MEVTVPLLRAKPIAVCVPALACQKDSDEGTESGLDVRDEQVQRIEAVAEDRGE